VFLNSHLLGEVEATCDRVAFVKQGRTVHELTLGVGHTDLDVELRIDRIGGSILAGLEQFGRQVTRIDGAVHLKVESDAALPTLVRWLVEQGVDVYEVRSRRPSLEQVFLDVIGEDQRPG
jgi:ABC-2 type transport system ATP-binding protein